MDYSFKKSYYDWIKIWGDSFFSLMICRPELLKRWSRPRKSKGNEGR